MCTNQFLHVDEDSFVVLITVTGNDGTGQWCKWIWVVNLVYVDISLFVKSIAESLDSVCKHTYFVFLAICK